MNRTLLPIALFATLPFAAACSSSSNGGSPTGGGDASASSDTGITADSGEAQNDSSVVADSGTGPDTGMTPEDSGKTPTDAAALSFGTDVYTSIVATHCLFCHGPTADGGPGIGIQFGHLDLTTEATAYANLLGDGGGAPATGFACGSTGLLRVVPGNPTSSLLYNKLASNDGDGGSLLLPDGGQMVFCGHPMPENHAALSATDLGTVQSWIGQGASP